MTDYIERPLYINRIKPFIGKSLIKVLIGQRRVGKSFLLMQIRDLIKAQSPEIQIIYINKEQHEFAGIKNSNDLFLYLSQVVEKDKKVVLKPAKNNKTYLIPGKYQIKITQGTVSQQTSLEITKDERK
jgi:predicted AAA+ superfamily ATPase